MKKLFGNMDWLKSLILICILASLGLGAWNWYLAKQFKEANAAWKRSQKDYVEVVALTKQIQTLYEALDQQGGVNVDPLTYFQKQLEGYAKIPSDSYSFGEVRTKERSLPGRGKKRRRTTKIRESTFEVKFTHNRKRDRRYLTREQVFVALYNAEKNSKRWSLMTLKMKARAVVEGHNAKKGYPEELQDEWVIDKLQFVSREPISSNKS